MTYGDIVGRFFFEAVPTMAVSPTVRFEALSAAVIGTKQIRYGPLPPPEVQVAVRDVIRNSPDGLTFFVPWGVTKQQPDAPLDVLEFMALRQLRCVQDTLRAYGTGAAFYFRLDDNSDRWLLGDDRAKQIAVYSGTLEKLIRAVLPELAFPRRESQFATYDEFHETASRLTPAFYRVITKAADPATLAEHGWKGDLPQAQLDYYYAAYRRFYPGQDHQYIAAKYFAGALTRHKLNAATAPPGPRVEVSFSRPVPGHPLAGSRVYYRTLPERYTHHHTAPWGGRGYMAISDAGTAAPRYVEHLDPGEAGRLVAHEVKVGEAVVAAPYLEA